MYRQGDVLLVPVDIPAYDLEYVYRTGKGEGIILAAGEATGHHHRIRERSAGEFRGQRMGRHGNRRFVRVGARGASITHEEHDTIKVPKGMYEIVQQREFAPEERDLTRRVYD